MWKDSTRPLLCRGQEIVKNRWNLSISNPKPDLHNINAHIRFGENPFRFTQELLSWNEKDESRADNSVKNWKNCPLAIPNKISIISMHISSLLKIHWDLLKLYCPEMKIQMCPRQITLSKINKICLLAILNQSLQCQCTYQFWWKSIDIYSSYHQETKIWMWANNSVKNWQNLPINKPKPDLHIINAHTKFGEKPLIFTKVIIQKRKYRWANLWQMDRHTDSQQETFIPSHYRVANIIKTITPNMPFFLPKKVLVLIFFLYDNMSWCSIEVPHWGTSNGYAQHMLLWRNY